MPQVLVVGDDLTGSNATGALYARLGLRAVTVSTLDQVRRFAGRADVLVVNTGSRHWPAGRAYDAVRAVVAAAGPVPLVAKRVDTTLRGNPGRELDAVLDALAAAAAEQPAPAPTVSAAPTAPTRVLAVPAFPDAGRTTVGGLHLVDGVPLTRTAVACDPFDPVRHSRVAALLGEQTSRSTAELPLDVVESGIEQVVTALRAATADIVIGDATENAHLHTIAAAAARIAAEDGVRWTVLDSGPFGAAYSAALGIRPQGAEPPRVLAVVGSITERTGEQLDRAASELGAVWTELDPERPEPGAVLRALRAAADEGATVLGVRVATGTTRPVPNARAAERILHALSETARRAVTELRPGGLYASGGDVAAAVTAALGAEGFAIETEVLPLAVAGHLVGGPHDGLHFATKGGLIGGPDAARDCLDHLRVACTRDALRGWERGEEEGGGRESNGTLRPIARGGSSPSRAYPEAAAP
ncbi:four-carbon acid sugar kinase family protein [Streptomyces violens]|uniref:four-carbon acid sugar kinase family protein n=1 Tax=Streptomyces violens TaxID=66377 RepID=UPI000998DD4A|nr:four-carbon acid sugar kinase family protein [Streptomyces violens]